MHMHAVVFANPDFKQEWPAAGSDDDPNDIVWGQDLTAFVVQQLDARGMDVGEARMFAGEGGWTVQVTNRGVLCNVFVHWAAFGRPPVDHWVIQVAPRHGFFALLTGRRSHGNLSAYEIALAIRDAVESLEGSKDVRLVDEDGFRRIY
jgi:hypothetical protein